MNRTPTEPAPLGPPRLGLVLGGGGLKGFAHIGALQALAERGLAPRVLAGSSIGALIGAAFVGKLPIETMRARALALRRKELFRINHVGMLLERMQSRSIYLEEPLRALIADIVPDATFHQLGTPLLINTVDLLRGTPLVWGSPGFTHAHVRDAVYASCALPGFFPPGDVGGRICVDGGTVDNLPATIVRDAQPFGAVDRIIAVDVGNADLATAGMGGRAHLLDAADTGPMSQLGFAATFMRAASVMMHALQRGQLARYHGPPLLVVRPRVSHVPWFSFADTPELIGAGYAAMSAALDHAGPFWHATSGLFPRERVSVTVQRNLCTGCGQCVAIAPHALQRDAEGRAIPLHPDVEWTPADGDLARYCPTGALHVVPVGPFDTRSAPVSDAA
ncbi:MAG: patatin-like phospholipase family protein [Gemmatimonadaceae bacterium]|jgi:NTE family protein|nr:patatin-like phospholipase family protein [Gemmatimonadaceae bacterium]